MVSGSYSVTRLFWKPQGGVDREHMLCVPGVFPSLMRGKPLQCIRYKLPVRPSEISARLNHHFGQAVLSSEGVLQRCASVVQTHCGYHETTKSLAETR